MHGWSETDIHTTGKTEDQPGREHRTSDPLIGYILLRPPVLGNK